MSGDSLNLLAYQAGLVATPLSEAAADASGDLCTEQKLMRIGDPLPIVFARRQGSVGGCVVSPGATEARFANDAANVLTTSWHLVVGEGPMDPIEVRDVFQCACRVGTSTQAYNRRAGSWSPGNVTVNRGGTTTPWEVPRFCGSAGTHQGLTTLSFVNTFADKQEWNRQIHVFIRGGKHVTRLLDGVLGPSANVVDLYLHLLRSVERVPESLINLDSLRHAARFSEQLGMRWDGVLGQDETENLDDWCENILKPCYLLARTRVQGQEGLMPLLPTKSDGTLFLGSVAPHATLTENELDLETWNLEFLSLADRRPMVAQMMWRQQGDGIQSLARTTEVRFAPPFNAPDGPFEQFDLSRFCTSETHAVKVGAFLVSHRALCSHTLEVSARPGAHNTTLADGSIVRVTVPRAVDGQALGTHDYLYRVAAIGKDLQGETQYRLIHLPIDAQGRSAISVAVNSTQAPGLVLPFNITGPTCDVNSSTNDTGLPTDVVDWNLPTDNPFDVPIPTDGLPLGDPLDGPLDPPIPLDPPFPPEPPEPPVPPEPPSPDPPQGPPLGDPPVGDPPPGSPGNPDAPLPQPPAPPADPPGVPGVPGDGPDGPGGPQWGPPGPPRAGVYYDLEFEQMMDTYYTVGLDEKGKPVLNYLGQESYPAGVTQGEWKKCTMTQVSSWTHVQSGNTKYVPGTGGGVLKGSIGINAVRISTNNAPNYTWSSTGQGFNGETKTPIGPFRNVVFFHQIRNFTVRKHGASEPFRPAPPPPPFSY